MLDQFEQWLHADHDARRRQRRARSGPCGSATAPTSSASSWCATTSRWRRRGSCGRSRSGSSRAITSPPSMPFDLVHARKVLREFGLAYDRFRDEDHGPFRSVPRSGGGRAGRRRQDRAGPAGAFCADAQGQALDPGDAQGHEGPRGDRRASFSKNRWTAPLPTRSIGSTSQAARHVLRALLPHGAADIKGHMRSYDELLEASGYARRPGDFDTLLSILGTELRLITPTDPARSGAATTNGGPPDLRVRLRRSSHRRRAITTSRTTTSCRRCANGSRARSARPSPAERRSVSPNARRNGRPAGRAATCRRGGSGS